MFTNNTLYISDSLFDIIFLTIFITLIHKLVPKKNGHNLE